MSTHTNLFTRHVHSREFVHLTHLCILMQVVQKMALNAPGLLVSMLLYSFLPLGQPVFPTEDCRRDGTQLPVLDYKGIVAFAFVS